jgi:hypothetical protein
MIATLEFRRRLRAALKGCLRRMRPYQKCILELQLIRCSVLNQLLDPALQGQHAARAGWAAQPMDVDGTPAAAAKKALCASTTVCVETSHCRAVRRTVTPASRIFTARRRRSFSADSGKRRELIFSMPIQTYE